MSTNIDPHQCKVAPFQVNHHSDDLIEVWHGSTTPAYVCGYHHTHFPELIDYTDKGSVTP